MMTHKEIHQRLPDYVLGLLTPGQTHEVTEHLVDCAVCRREVLSEREIGALIRNAVHVTTYADAARLRRLMPAAARQSRPAQIATNWAGRLAPALVVLFLIVGSMIMVAPESKRPMSLFIAATATATSTNTPTATIAQESGHLGAGAPAVSQREANGIPRPGACRPGATPTTDANSGPRPNGCQLIRRPKQSGLNNCEEEDERNQYHTRTSQQRLFIPPGDSGNQS